MKMKIKGQEILLTDVLKEEDFSKKMHTIRESGLFLSDEEVEILKKYHIDYLSCTSLSQLINCMEATLMDEDIPELEQLSIKMAEQNYYQNTRK